MASHIKARSLALVPLVVVLFGAVSGCSGAAVGDVAVAAPSKTPVTVAPPALETMDPVKTPKRSTCKRLASEVVRIAGAGESDYPEIVGISALTVVKDRQAAYKSGALKTTAVKPQVEVLSCRGTAAWDDKSTTGVQFQLSYAVNGGRSVAYQRT